VEPQAASPNERIRRKKGLPITGNPFFIAITKGPALFFRTGYSFFVFFGSFFSAGNRDFQSAKKD